MLVTLFVENANENGVFGQSLLVKQVEGVDSATTLEIRVVRATVGRNKFSGASPGLMALVVYFYRSFVFSWQLIFLHPSTTHAGAHARDST